MTTTTTTANAPQTFSIFIPAGTIVAELRNQYGKVVSDTVKLAGDVYIDNATRHEDGCWAYSVGRACYLCAGGMATVLS